MAKQTLYKLYYSNRSEYEMEYNIRFNGDETIHIGINIGINPAFVCPTDTIYKNIISIERTDKKINELYKRLPKVAMTQFAKRCLIDEIVLTNNIEGVHSTRKEIDLILQDLSQNDKRERFVGLVRKYNLLMSNEKIELKSCWDIRKIYDDIFYEEIKTTDSANLPDGEIFRKKSVSVCSATQKEIHQGLMPESNIISAMDKALEFLNNEKVDFLIRIAVFHYLFGYIHPFYDGNGRCSRFISSYLLSRNLNHLIGYRISYTVKENIKEYYDAFKICNHKYNKGDLTPFTEMFLDIVNVSMIQLCEALEERVINLERYERIIGSMPNYTKKADMHKLYYVLIQAALFSDKGIALKELLEYMELSYNSIRSRLKMIPEELLKCNQQGKEKYYMLNIDELDRYVN